MTPLEIAMDWRQQNGYADRGGVVIVFNGEVQSCVNHLRNPEHWQPGCIAVDAEAARGQRSRATSKMGR